MCRDALTCRDARLRKRQAVPLSVECWNRMERIQQANCVVRPVSRCFMARSSRSPGVHGHGNWTRALYNTDKTEEAFPLLLVGGYWCFFMSSLVR
jgi:hypothetical protein